MRFLDRCRVRICSTKVATKVPIKIPTKVGRKGATKIATRLRPTSAVARTLWRDKSARQAKGSFRAVFYLGPIEKHALLTYMRAGSKKRKKAAAAYFITRRPRGAT